MASRYRIIPKDNIDNVLITQIQERNDSPISIISEPPVKDTPAILIRTEISCQQSNHVLRHNIHVKHVDALLEEKRLEVEERMRVCDVKRHKLRDRQLKIKDKVERFKEFIDENEMKRRRAFDKFQNGFRNNLEKKEELVDCKKENRLLIKKESSLRKELVEIKKYEDFLLTVLDMLPEDYLEVHDSKLNSLILRHSTLSETKNTLLDYVTEITDTLENERSSLGKCEEEGERRRLAIDGKLAREQSDLEKFTTVNSTSDSQLCKYRNEFRQRMVDYANILLAINNINEKCSFVHDSSFKVQSIFDKLTFIDQFIKEKSSIIKMLSNVNTKNREL